MGTKPSGSEKRQFERASLGVPLRLVPKDRPQDVVEGETVDISLNGIGAKFGRRLSVDALLERLVEDRLPVEISLRLPEGSVSTEGQLMWWGLLGEDEAFGIRAGVLLPKGWAERDWQLISRSVKVS